jgi:hypothetical protein
MWPRLPGPRRDGYVIRAGPVRLDRGLTVVSTSVPSTVEAICIKKNDVQWDSSCRGSPPAPRMHCVYQHRAQQRKVRVAVKIRSCAKGHLPSCRPQPTDLALRLYYGVSVLFAYLRHGACRMPGVPPGRQLRQSRRPLLFPRLLRRGAQLEHSNTACNMLQILLHWFGRKRQRNTS